MTRQDAINSLVKAVEDRNYGDVLTFDEIALIINVKRFTTSFHDILQAARKRLIVEGHMIVNVRGVGYKVCPPDSYTDVGVRYMRQGARRIDKGAKVLNHAPVNDMSQTAREAHNRVNDRMTRLQAAMAGASVEIHMLSTKKNPLLSAK